MKKTGMMVAVVFATGMLFGACGSTENNETATEANTEKQVAINTTHAYICPMDCENSASMEPGTCAVCGMDLVANPNYAGAETGEAMNEEEMASDSAATSTEETEEMHSESENH
jgi:hypothetical protein